MIERLGCRPVVMIGSIFGAVGLGTTVFATQPWHLIISFGFATGENYLSKSRRCFMEIYL